MFNLNRKTDYALVALARLASSRCEQGENPGEDRGEAEPLSARAIAEEFDLPLQGLMGIMKELHRAGLVDSIRGAKGGYTLASPPESMSVAAVISAIEGPAQLAPCCDDSDDDDCVTCKLIARCPISAAIRDVSGQISRYLHTVTIAQLLESEKGSPLPELKPSNLPTGASAAASPVQVNVKIAR